MPRPQPQALSPVKPGWHSTKLHLPSEQAAFRASFMSSGTPTTSRNEITMSAAVLAQPGVVEVARIPRPEPGPRELRVRIESCGVCASNLGPWQGAPWFSYPFAPGALGHEA